MAASKTRRRKLSGTTRHSTEMDILEKPMEWLQEFQQGWLAHYEDTGLVDWKKYVRPRNRLAPSGPAVKLAESRLLLISSAGAYLHGSQEPFDASNPFGDYTVRSFPSDSPFEAISFAHEHYDHQHKDLDPQVLLPLRHLEEMVSTSIVGEMAPNVISFSGYHPDVIRVVKELIPSILAVAKEDQVSAALLIPSSSLCIQSVGLIARALEVNEIAATLTTWNAGLLYLTAPPRATSTRLKRGCTLGQPNDHAQQRRVLQATLDLLALDAPQKIVRLDEIAE